MEYEDRQKSLGLATLQDGTLHSHQKNDIERGGAIHID